jgi:hypothetical protein
MVSADFFILVAAAAAAVKADHLFTLKNNCSFGVK